MRDDLEPWAVFLYFAVFALVGGWTGAALFEFVRITRWRNRNAAARSSCLRNDTVTLHGTRR
jgi:hypothetical protein